MEGSGAIITNNYGSGSEHCLQEFCIGAQCTCITGGPLWNNNNDTVCSMCVCNRVRVSDERRLWNSSFIIACTPHASTSDPIYMKCMDINTVLHLPTRIQNRTNSSEICMAFQRHFFMWVCLLWLSPMGERVGVAVGHTLWVGGLPFH